MKTLFACFNEYYISLKLVPNILGNSIYSNHGLWFFNIIVLIHGIIRITIIVHITSCSTSEIYESGGLIIKFTEWEIAEFANSAVSKILHLYHDEQFILQ